MDKLNILIKQKNEILTKLNNLLFGSIEIRENDKKKYIYIHFRTQGKLNSKYVGEYSKELYEVILENNILAKQLKKELKQIQKQLDVIDYKSFELNDSVKLNIDFARKHFVELIYAQAKLEGVATTYSDIETIINGGKVNNMSTLDITKIINLKHAWEFILSEGVISYPTNYTLICQINGIVEENIDYTAGKIRTVPVSIIGTKYKPTLPFESLVKEELQDINNSPLSNIDKAIELLLYVMKRQLFIDGNKRTAVLTANHYLISHGLGLILIDEKLLDKFKKLLIDYYEDKNNNVKAFLIKKCFLKI